MGRVRAADLDAVLLDVYGTLVTLADPVPALAEILEARGVQRSNETIRAGVHAEIAHYGPRASEGSDEESLARLQRDCAAVFLDTIDSDLDPEDFAPAYVGALQFDVLPGVSASLERLRALGLELAAVANWDLTLRARLEEAQLTMYFTAIVHSAAKPAPDGLLRALHELGVPPARALYIGDSESDMKAAAAASVAFAPAPLPEVIARLA